MRLKSKNPAWNGIANINTNESQVANKLIDKWKEEPPTKNHLIHDPNNRLLGFNLLGYSLKDFDLVMDGVRTF